MDIRGRTSTYVLKLILSRDVGQGNPELEKLEIETPGSSGAGAGHGVPALRAPLPGVQPAVALELREILARHTAKHESYTHRR